MITRARFFKAITGFFAACGAGIAAGGLTAFPPIWYGEGTGVSLLGLPEESGNPKKITLTIDSTNIRDAVELEIEKRIGQIKWLEERGDLPMKISLVDGGEVDVYYHEVMTSQVKPTLSRDGSLWRSRRITGIMAMADDGAMYWQEEDGHWSLLRPAVPVEGLISRSRAVTSVPAAVIDPEPAS